MHYHPTTAAPTLSPPLRHRLFWIAALITTGAFFQFFIAGIAWNDAPASLASMLDGTADRPFVFRVLIPSLVHLVGLVFPTLHPQLIVSTLLYLALLGFVAALRLLCAAFWTITPRIEFTLLFAPIALLPLALAFRHIYDLPTLFFFTLGLALLAHQRWNAYSIVYTLGCLNKETTLFLVAIYVVWFARKLPWSLFGRLLVLQLAIFGVIRITLLELFQQNPGDVMSFFFFKHMAIYAEMPSFTLFYALMLAGLVTLLIRFAPGKPHQLQQAAVVLLVIIGPLFLLFGFPFEIRVFYEAFAPVYLLSLPSTCFPAPLNSAPPPPLPSHSA